MEWNSDGKKMIGDKIMVEKNVRRRNGDERDEMMMIKWDRTKWW